LNSRSKASIEFENHDNGVAKMINYKPVLAAAVIALAAPLAATSPSFAQGAKPHGAHVGGGHIGGGHMGGGRHMGRGGGFSGARIGGGGGRHMAGGGGWHGGGQRGGGWHGGGHYRHGGGGFIPGAIAGAVIGGALAAPYYGSGYYDDSYGYYDDGPAVQVVPGGGDDVAYCQQRYKSYDINSGTYLGYDGLRHPCP